MNPMPRPLPAGWKIDKHADKFATPIEITAPNGYVAHVTKLDRNPANVLYMLADALLAANRTPEAEAA